MDTLENADWRVKTLGKLLRSARPVRGRGRIARMLLNRDLRAKPVIVVDDTGNSIVVPNLLEPVGLSLWLDGSYEPETKNFLLQHASVGSLVLDIGANIGVFTVPLSKRVGAAGLVIAIEASPLVAATLHENLSRNGSQNVSVYDCAASDGAAPSVPFYPSPDSKFGMGSSAQQFGVAPVEIPARSVDQILSEFGRTDVSVMKVDVEGFEAHVFLGASALLQSANPPWVIFEFCDWAEERAFKGKRGWAQQILIDLGYRLWRLGDLGQEQKQLSSPIRTGFEAIVGVPLRHDICTPTENHKRLIVTSRS